MDAIAQEAARIEEGLSYYEHTHRLTAQFWNRVNLGVGIVATIAAGLSALLQATIDDEDLSILLATLAAALAATITFLSPRERADEHRKAEREANRLRLAFRRFRQLDLTVRFGADEIAALDAIERLADERDRILANMPTTSQRKFEQARRQIRRGIFKYDADESADE